MCVCGCVCVLVLCVSECVCARVCGDIIVVAPCSARVGCGCGSPWTRKQVLGNTRNAQVGIMLEFENRGVVGSLGSRVW